MSWKVRWEPDYDRISDLLISPEGCGEAEFSTKEAAKHFAMDLMSNGIKISSNGVEILGSELKVTIIEY